MFVTVKFGECEEGVFNPQCKCISLLSTIREKCCVEEVELDLSDENGNVKNLRENPNRYADELLTDREKLVLLKVDRSETGDCSFVPLLNDQGFLTETFLAQLANDAGSGRSDDRKSRNSGRRQNKQKSDTKDSSSNKTAKSGTANSQTKSKSRNK